MGDKDKIFEEKVAFEGIFNLKDTYSFLYTLLADSGYAVEEKEYKEKAAGDSKDIDISWVAKRAVTDYFKYEWRVSWRVMGMKNVEVMKDGKKIKMNSGALEIKFIGIMERDYAGGWSTPFLTFLRGIYDNFIIKKTKGGYEDRLADEVGGAVNQIKSYLVLEAKV